MIDVPDIAAADFENQRLAKFHALASTITDHATERRAIRNELRERRLAAAAKLAAIEKLRKEIPPPLPMPKPQFAQRHFKTIPEIMTMCERYYRLNPGAISGPRRFKSLANARQVAMYLCRVASGKTYTDIGRAMRRDHSTIIHGTDSILDRLETDRTLAAQVAELMVHLGVEHGSDQRGAVRSAGAQGGL